MIDGTVAPPERFAKLDMASTIEPAKSNTNAQFVFFEGAATVLRHSPGFFTQLLRAGYAAKNAAPVKAGEKITHFCKKTKKYADDNGINRSGR